MIKTVLDSLKLMPKFHERLTPAFCLFKQNLSIRGCPWSRSYTVFELKIQMTSPSICSRSFNRVDMLNRLCGDISRTGMTKLRCNVDSDSIF